MIAQVQTTVLTKNPINDDAKGKVTKDERKKDYRTLWGYFDSELKFFNILLLGYLHFMCIKGVIEFDWIGKSKQVICLVVYSWIGAFGILAGAHRYFTHRSYKATRPFQIFLLACYTLAGHDHRVHHKYSETNADPHNSERGFFFSHVGWLFLKKHPDVIRKGKTVDMSDMTSDPLLVWYNKYYLYLSLTFGFIIPIIIYANYFNEPWSQAATQFLGRYVIFLNLSWSVNSAAHIFGRKPYNKSVNARENALVAFIAMGEGWHNYHHVFSWDYRASELGKWNPTAFILQIFGKLGLCYDFKTASGELVRKVANKLGDGSDGLKLGGIPQNAEEVEDWIMEKTW